MRFSPISNNSTPVTAVLGHHPSPAEYFAMASEDTAEAIDAMADWDLRFRGISEGTVRNRTRDLGQVFRLLAYDPGLGRDRPITLPDLLRPGHGALLMSLLRGSLGDLGVPETVIDRYFSAVRVLGLWAVEHHVLPSGVDLRERYGRLACPLGKFDIRRRKRPPVIGIPTHAQLGEIVEEAKRWASARVHAPYEAWRNASVFIVRMGCSARTIEAAALNLADQFPDPLSDAALIDGRLRLYLDTSKNGDPREILLEPFAVEQLRWWLSEMRPVRAPKDRGYIFPAAGRAETPLASATLAEGIRCLIRHLQAQGLLSQSFQAHHPRKVWATHRLAEGWSLVDVMRYGGWRSPQSLAAYVGASSTIVATQRETFIMARGRRSF